jgi:pyruvate kinase
VVGSLENLAHYLSLRHHDLRKIQHSLRVYGLSSLGRSEAQVLPNLDAVIATLAAMVNRSDAQIPTRPTSDDFMRGGSQLAVETVNVLGASPEHRRGYIMVTLETEQGQNLDFVCEMLNKGMNIARINCAHDDPTIWKKMIDTVHQASDVTGHPCKIAMDLGGPKVRTAYIDYRDHQRIYRDDQLCLTRKKTKKIDGNQVTLNCTLPMVIDMAGVGEPVWFDDGKIGAIIESKTDDSLMLRVTHASYKGDKLKEDKGINFPHTHLNLSALTEKDYQDLEFVVRYADIINYSFVQTADDIEQLHRAIQSHQPSIPPAVICKIETARAIQNLPDIIAKTSAHYPIGVMIARGDLAVEIGFERMAEMQEEILWVCEAAHIPVVWATQVLESLAKKGRPSRAEITDAAMAERSECVMLNKGDYILDAIVILDSILRRMAEHQSKKSAQLRQLKSW